MPAAVYYLFIQLYGTELLGISLIFDEENWVSWVLPVFSMSLGNIAYYAMWLRRYMVDESTKDYVQLAKIKGVSSNRIMFTHIFRNAFVPMAQYIPTSFLNTVVGSIYIESLYSIPGMGGLLVDVVKKQDNNMVQGIVLVFACVGVVGLIFGDLLMGSARPAHQLRLEKEETGNMGIIKHPSSEALERECSENLKAALDEAEAFQFAEFDAKEVERTGYSNYSYWGSTFRAFYSEIARGPRLHCADHPGVHVFAAVPSRAV